MVSLGNIVVDLKPSEANRYAGNGREQATHPDSIATDDLGSQPPHARVSLMSGPRHQGVGEGMGNIGRGAGLGFRAFRGYL